MVAASFNMNSDFLPVNRSANFEQKVIEGIRDLMLVLAADGRVLHASSLCFEFTNVCPKDMVGKHMTSFMHHDDLSEFLLGFKECMETGESWRLYHRIRRRHDTFSPFESTFRPFVDTEIAKSAGLTGLPMCLMISRPYISAPTTLMDSFLEQWTKNVQLQNLLNQLRKEEESSSEGTILIENVELTVDVKAKNVRLDTPESVKCGKDRQDNACSSSIHPTSQSTSSPSKLSEVLISGDVGIKIKTSRLHMMQDSGSWAPKPRSKRNTNKSKEYICKECGSADSPEWRKGPSGPKTLCNACGIRWSKARKTRDKLVK